MTIAPVEIHPFPPFVPQDSSRLILGSFPGRKSTQAINEDDWYYSAKRNQFWPIMERVFGCTLQTKPDRQQFFHAHKIAITDIIHSCRRKNNRNVDTNLIDKTYNTAVIRQILEENPIRQIFFTGKGVYQEFIAKVKIPVTVEMISLPSPSPAHQMISLSEKVGIYRDLLYK